MGILSGTENTLKEGDKLIYDMAWEKYLACQHLFGAHSAVLVAGREEPYFRVNSIRTGIFMCNYFSYKERHTLGWDLTNPHRIIPDWIKFKVHQTTKQPKRKSVVILYVGEYDDYTYTFSDGSKIKEFDNCIVHIKKKLYT